MPKRGEGSPLKKSAGNKRKSGTKTLTEATVTIDNTEEQQRSDPSATLHSIHASKEVSIKLDKSVFINGEVTLSSNLLVRHIKSTSEAVHSLLIDDQILSINRKVASNEDEVLDMVRESIKSELEITVSRQANKSPAPQARLTFHDGEEVFKRSNGAQYFVVKLSKVDGAHLGFKVKAYRGRIIVTEVQENGVASFNYRVGDSILDLNSEQVKEVDSFHKRFIGSTQALRGGSTLVERPISQSEVANAKVIIDVLAKSKLDPPLPKDVVAIGQRERVRYQANLGRRRTLRSAFQKKRRRRKKRRSLLAAKPDEEKISTDVKNPSFLQKIPKHKSPASSLTFFPRFFK